MSGNQTHSASLGNRVGLHYSRFRLFARANSVNNQWFTDLDPGTKSPFPNTNPRRGLGKVTMDRCSGAGRGKRWRYWTANRQHGAGSGWICIRSNWLKSDGSDLTTATASWSCARVPRPEPCGNTRRPRFPRSADCLSRRAGNRPHARRSCRRSRPDSPWRRWSPARP